MFSRIFQNIFFTEHLQTTASAFTISALFTALTSAVKIVFNLCCIFIKTVSFEIENEFGTTDVQTRVFSKIFINPDVKTFLL